MGSGSSSPLATSPGDSSGSDGLSPSSGGSGGSGELQAAKASAAGWCHSGAAASDAF
jgi:hypothetical protein